MNRNPRERTYVTLYSSVGTGRTVRVSRDRWRAESQVSLLSSANSRKYEKESPPTPSAFRVASMARSNDESCPYNRSNRLRSRRHFHGSKLNFKKFYRKYILSRKYRNYLKNVENSFWRVYFVAQLLFRQFIISQTEFVCTFT